MRRALLGVVLLLALTGCGGGDPKVDPSPSPSAPLTTPVSTTPSAPVMPDEAKADTKAGAIAFVRHYVDLINFAQATGVVDTMAAVESDACRSCASARRTLTSIYSSGGHIQGGALSASITKAAQRPDLAAWTVFAAVRFGPQEVVRPEGSTSLKGGRSVMTIVVKYSVAGWKVQQWSRAS